MIIIHIGVLPTENLSSGSEVVRDTKDYVLTRQYIHDALSQEKELEVFVLTRVCDNWFWDLREYYDDIILIDDAPTERLKRKLSIAALPVDLAAAPETIIKLGILDLPDPKHQVVDVWKWIFEHKLGLIWTVETPSLEHLSGLVSWYIDHTVESVLQPKVAHIAQNWIDTASGKVRSAYTRFFEDPQRNAYSLITWRALTLYDRELREQWVMTEGWYSRKLEDLVDLIEIPTQLPKFIHDKLNIKIQTYWNTRLKG